MDQKGGSLMEPILTARGLVKRYGKVTALDKCDFDLMPGEILAVIGDNGAGKSSLIKAISGAVVPDSGTVTLEGKPVRFSTPIEAREAGIETVYQTLAMSPALSIADNMFMGRELRKPGFRGKYLRQLDRRKMEEIARAKLTELGLMTIQNINQAVETLSGGQRQGVAVARAAAFGSKVIILDEPTAALGVKESRKVLELIQDVRSRGIPIILISHNMPHVFEVADRIHVHRLGKRLCVIDPKDYTMSDAVAFMTGAKEAPGSAEAV
jgi:fructose transport system ATP-binding protein